MALSAFDDKEHPPAHDDLIAVLGKSAARWDAVIDDLRERYPPIDEQWGFSGKKWGWGLRAKRKKRAILYLTPQEGFFYVGFALGEKAVHAALDARLPKRIVEAIDAAPRYAEGRGLRLEVRRDADLGWVHKLAAAKMAH
jgi:hypothetical protein